MFVPSEVPSAVSVLTGVPVPVPLPPAIVIFPPAKFVPNAPEPFIV